MRRYKTRPRKDRKIFRSTANKSLGINNRVVATRGGTRL